MWVNCSKERLVDMFKKLSETIPKEKIDKFVRNNSYKSIYIVYDPFLYYAIRLDNHSNNPKINLIDNVGSEYSYEVSNKVYNDLKKIFLKR